MPIAFRDTFTLYPVRAGRNAAPVRDVLSLAGFSRCRCAVVASKIPIILGSIKTSRRRATKELPIVRCAKHYAISWRVTPPILLPSRVLRRILRRSAEVRSDDKQFSIEIMRLFDTLVRNHASQFCDDTKLSSTCYG